MSDLYNAYYRKSDPKRYDKRDKDGNSTPLDMVKMEEGLAFEEILEPVLAARLLGQRPKEQKVRINRKGEIDPKGAIVLYFSPDYIFFINDESVLGEFKYTRYSSKGAPRGPKFAKWITQIKLYCYVLGLNVARLYVLYLNGDYKPPTAKLLAWELRFTDDELEEEWNIIMRHAREEGLLNGTTGKESDKADVDARRRTRNHS